MKLGERIEERIKERGMTKAEFGRRINTSRQNVNTLLRKDSFDTRLLVKIGKVLEYDFFQHLQRPNKAEPDRGEPEPKLYMIIELPPDYHDKFKHLILK